MFIISTSSSAKVFHRYGCPYTYRIANEHYQEIRTKTAKKYGLRPCKCCASMPQRDNCDEAILRGCCRKASFSCKYEPSTQCFFLRTDFGFWKLLQSSSGDYLLYHSSAFDPALPFEELQKRPFHRQTDVVRTSSVQKIFSYIQKHDHAKAIIADDYRKLPRKTKKEKRYFRQARSRAYRSSAQHLYKIMDLIAAGAENREVLAC